MFKMVAFKDSSLTACVLLTAFILRSDAQNGASRQCGGNYAGSGLIQSPNYPYNYLNLLNCTWNLQASPQTGRISLEIQEFLTESCCDILRIFNGSTQVYRFSGPQATSGILLGSQATLVFTTDHSVVTTGFSIRFTTFVDACGLIFYDKGVIQSPSYVPSYMTQCLWSLSALPLQNMRLLFLQFNVQTCCDVLVIYNNANGVRTTVSALSGNVLPTSVMLGSSAEMQLLSSTGNQLSRFMICFYSTTLLTSAASAVQIGQCVKFLNDPWPELCNQMAVFNVTCTCTGCTYNYRVLAISSLSVSMGESEPVCGFLENVLYSCVISASVSGSVVDTQNVPVLLVPEKLPTTAPPTQPTRDKTSEVITEHLRSSTPAILVGTGDEESKKILPSTLAGALVGVLLALLLVGLSVAAWRRRWYIHVFELLNSKIRSLRKGNVEENIYENSLSVTQASSDLHNIDIAVAHVDGVSNLAYIIDVHELRTNDLYIEGEMGYSEEKYDGEEQVNLDGSSRTEAPQQIGPNDSDGSAKLHDVTPQNIVKKALMPPRTRLNKPAETYGEVGRQLYETLKIPNLNDGEPTYARLDL